MLLSGTQWRTNKSRVIDTDGSQSLPFPGLLIILAQRRRTRDYPAIRPVDSFQFQYSSISETDNYTIIFHNILSPFDCPIFLSFVINSVINFFHEIFLCVSLLWFNSISESDNSRPLIFPANYTIIFYNILSPFDCSIVLSFVINSAINFFYEIFLSVSLYFDSIPTLRVIIRVICVFQPIIQLFIFSRLSIARLFSLS